MKIEEFVRGLFYFFVFVIFFVTIIFSFILSMPILTIADFLFAIVSLIINQKNLKKSWLFIFVTEQTQICSANDKLVFSK